MVADQRTGEAADQLRAAVKAACPKGVTAELKVLSSGEPSLTDPDNPFIDAAAEALKRSRDALRLFHSANAKPVFACFSIRAKSISWSWAKAQSQPDSAAAVSQRSFVSIAWSG